MSEDSPFFHFVGIAWFDDVPPPPGERALRAGGEPLLPAELAWPTCPRCDLPMLFRAQLPLLLTTLVSYEDDRMLSVFECHSGEAGGCDGGALVVAGGELEIRNPPPARHFDVIVHAIGDRPDEVMRVIAALDPYGNTAQRLPRNLLVGSPPSIAREAMRAIAEAGGMTELRPSPPMLISPPRGGNLVPFDDDVPGITKTTLPPLSELATASHKSPIRGLLGGYLPGNRDGGLDCSCGRPRRTALRLFGQPTAPMALNLGPTVARVCVRCGTGTVQRSRPFSEAACG